MTISGHTQGMVLLLRGLARSNASSSVITRATLDFAALSLVTCGLFGLIRCTGEVYPSEYINGTPSTLIKMIIEYNKKVDKVPTVIGVKLRRADNGLSNI